MIYGKVKQTMTKEQEKAWRIRNVKYNIESVKREMLKSEYIIEFGTYERLLDELLNVKRYLNEMVNDVKHIIDER